jgi:hypothetical protein
MSEESSPQTNWLTVPPEQWPDEFTVMISAKAIIGSILSLREIAKKLREAVKLIEARGYDVVIHENPYGMRTDIICKRKLEAVLR